MTLIPYLTVIVIEGRIMVQKPKPIEFNFKDREGLLERLNQSNMPVKDRELLTGLIEFNLWLQHSVEEKKIPINKLQKMFGHTSEKRDKKKQQGASGKEGNKTEDESTYNGNDAAESPVDNTENDIKSNPESVTRQTTNIRKYVSNTGRLGHEAYTKAEIIFLSTARKLGDPCSDPNCKGRLKMFEPGNIIKVVGQSFAQANKYVIETLRCGLCERYVKAKLPDNVCSEKYDPAFKAQLCVYNYFLGVSNYRLERLSENDGRSST
jgi:hypothetical protein